MSHGMNKEYIENKTKDIFGGNVSSSKYVGINFARHGRLPFEFRWHQPVGLQQRFCLSAMVWINLFLPSGRFIRLRTSSI